MRILIVTHYFNSHGGGVEIVAGRLAEEWAAMGINVSWMASRIADEEPSPHPARLLPVNACNLLEARTGVPFPLWGIGAAGRLWREVHSSDVVVLHDSLYPGNVMAVVCTRLQRKPYVVIQHIGLVPYRSAALRILMKIANFTIAKTVLRGAERVIFISSSVQAYFSNLLRRPRLGVLIHNGVDTRLYHNAGTEERAAARAALGIPPDVFVCLFVGRFVEKKGMHVIDHLTEEMDDMYWLFAGRGPLPPTARTNVKVVTGLSGVALAPLYHAADLLVLPSVGEGLPLVMQEALASGTPVLCSDETAQADARMASCVFTEPVNLNDVGSTAARWRTKIETLRANVGARRERGTLGAALAQNAWSWRSASEQHIAIFRDVARQQ